MQKAKTALIWIVRTLQRHRIPFQLTGGMAARVYGARRPIADIDLSVPEQHLPRLARILRPYVQFGPARYRDGHWDLLLLTLRYADMELDLGGARRARIFDRTGGVWVPCPTDLTNSQFRSVLGLRIPVESRETLLEYKRLLARPCDLADIAAITPNNR